MEWQGWAVLATTAFALGVVLLIFCGAVGIGVRPKIKTNLKVKVR